MRKSTLHPQLEELRVTPEQSAKFDAWLAAELADAKAARTALEALWRELVRQYDAVPRTPFRNTDREREQCGNSIGRHRGGFHLRPDDRPHLHNQPTHHHPPQTQRLRPTRQSHASLGRSARPRNQPAPRASTPFSTRPNLAPASTTPFVESHVKTKPQSRPPRPSNHLDVPDDVLMWVGCSDSVQGLSVGLSLRFYLTLDDSTPPPSTVNGTSPTPNPAPPAIDPPTPRAPLASRATSNAATTSTRSTMSTSATTSTRMATTRTSWSTSM